MCKLVFGADFVDQNCVTTSLINVNSPLTYDGIMNGALAGLRGEQSGVHRLPVHHLRRNGTRVARWRDGAGAG